MFLGLMALFIVATVPPARGRLTALGEVRVRWLPLLLAALLMQVLITVTFTSAPPTLLATAHVASYAAAGWVLWVNRRIPGLWLISLGTAANLLPIVLNGGTLPASPVAERAAGIDVTTSFANSGVLHHARLGFLGDTMSSPSYLPFRNVVSIGDLVILVGFALLVHRVCGSVLGRALDRWRRAVRVAGVADVTNRLVFPGGHQGTTAPARHHGVAPPVDVRVQPAYLEP